MDFGPDGSAHLTLRLFEEDGRVVAAVCDLEGRLRLRPKAWLRRVRAEMDRLEGVIRAAGISEIRIAGRWRGVFPGFVPFAPVRDAFHKRLT